MWIIHIKLKFFCWEEKIFLAQEKMERFFMGKENEWVIYDKKIVKIMVMYTESVFTYVSLWEKAHLKFLVFFFFMNYMFV